MQYNLPQAKQYHEMFSFIKLTTQSKGETQEEKKGWVVEDEATEVLIFLFVLAHKLAVVNTFSNLFGKKTAL